MRIPDRTAGLSCEVTTPGALGPSERERWAEIRAATRSLESPFFAPGFAAAIGAVRRDCRVAVLREGGSIVGFFPFHAGLTRAALPLGRKLSDYQGAIVDGGLEWSPAALIRSCGLRSYAFDHLVGAQVEFRPYFTAVARSPVVDLAGGLDPYGGRPHEAGRAVSKEILTKRRRLERRFALRFTWHEPGRAALAALLHWKSEQYRRARVFDVFSRRWVVDVVERLHATQTADLAGVLSCLYADETLIAVHMGLRSGQVLHSWFPAYDRRFAKHSPGLVLLMTLIEAAETRGVHSVDLGKGDEPYKLRFANGSIPVGVGSVAAGRVNAAAARLARASWSIALRSPLYDRAHRLRQRLQMG